MSEKRTVDRIAVVVLGALCIILTVGLIWTTICYTSLINDRNITITSLNSEISGLQDEILDMQDQITDLQNEVTNLHDLCVILFNQMEIINHTTNINGLGTVELSWYNAYFTSNGTKLGVTATIVNNSSIPAENISLVIDVSFYNYTTEHSTNFSIRIERLDIGEWYSLQKNIDVPEGIDWHFSVNFTLCVNEIETDHHSIGCY